MESEQGYGKDKAVGTGIVDPTEVDFRYGRWRSGSHVTFLFSLGFSISRIGENCFYFTRFFIVFVSWNIGNVRRYVMTSD